MLRIHVALIVTLISSLLVSSLVAQLPLHFTAARLTALNADQRSKPRSDNAIAQQDATLEITFDKEDSTLFTGTGYTISAECAGSAAQAAIFNGISTRKISTKAVSCTSSSGCKLSYLLRSGEFESPRCFNYANSERSLNHGQDLIVNVEANGVIVQQLERHQVVAGSQLWTRYTVTVPKQTGQFVITFSQPTHFGLDYDMWAISTLQLYQTTDPIPVPFRGSCPTYTETTEVRFPAPPAAAFSFKDDILTIVVKNIFRYVNGAFMISFKPYAQDNSFLTPTCFDSGIALPESGPYFLNTTADFSNQFTPFMNTAWVVEDTTECTYQATIKINKTQATCVGGGIQVEQSSAQDSIGGKIYFNYIARPTYSSLGLYLRAQSEIEFKVINQKDQGTQATQMAGELIGYANVNKELTLQFTVGLVNPVVKIATPRFIATEPDYGLFFPISVLHFAEFADVKFVSYKKNEEFKGDLKVRITACYDLICNATSQPVVFSFPFNAASKTVTQIDNYANRLSFSRTKDFASPSQRVEIAGGNTIYGLVATTAPASQYTMVVEQIVLTRHGSLLPGELAEEVLYQEGAATNAIKPLAAGSYTVPQSVQLAFAFEYTPQSLARRGRQLSLNAKTRIEKKIQRRDGLAANDAFVPNTVEFSAIIQEQEQTNSASSSSGLSQIVILMMSLVIGLVIM